MVVALGHAGRRRKVQKWATLGRRKPKKAKSARRGAFREPDCRHGSAGVITGRRRRSARGAAADELERGVGRQSAPCTRCRARYGRRGRRSGRARRDERAEPAPPRRSAGSSGARLLLSPATGVSVDASGRRSTTARSRALACSPARGFVLLPRPRGRARRRRPTLARRERLRHARTSLPPSSALARLRAHGQVAHARRAAAARPGRVEVDARAAEHLAARRRRDEQRAGPLLGAPAPP